MAFDFKKEYKEFYMPSAKPALVTLPPMNYLAVRGRGDPNTEGGEYQNSIPLLYGMAYTLKMSYKTDHRIKGFFEYVVPPLEGFWWQEGTAGMDYSRKDELLFLSLIRLPDFVSVADFEWARSEAARKKKMDFSPVEFLRYEEGCCVQCMHLGSYDTEPATIAAMHAFAAAQGYEPDITETRYHHEIYLSDPRKTAAEKLKTVVRHPIKETVTEK